MNLKNKTVSTVGVFVFFCFTFKTHVSFNMSSKLPVVSQCAAVCTHAFIFINQKSGNDKKK